MEPTDPSIKLRELLAPVLDKVAELAPETRRTRGSVLELEHAMERTFPAAAAHSREIGREIARGVREGWLCQRGDPNARFSRLAKPSANTHGMSVDVVSLEGKAIRHSHPLGEVTLGFAAEGFDARTCRFEGQPPGWVFLGPESTHTPEVTGGRMNLVYFLPEGAVVWHDAT